MMLLGVKYLMKDIQVSLFDIVMALSDVIDMVSPEIEGHHRRVAYMAVGIARKMKLPEESIRNLFLAALLHDCGALSLKERLLTLQFEMGETNGINSHAEMGYRLLRSFKPMDKAAQIIRYHHTYWNSPANSASDGLKPPVESFILHLADRVDVLTCRNRDYSMRADKIKEMIKRESGRKFMPDAVDAFLRLAGNRAFWMETANAQKESFRRDDFEDIILDLDGVFGVARLIEKIIDFRSRFTATHSSGVAAVAEELARAAGFRENECAMIKIAGYLHDLGKLAIPVEIIEKPDRLTEEEFNIMKKHTYYSYHILKKIKGLKDINHFASFHHERLNGKGYPFGLKADELSPGARVMCVADIFTAITEDRPYRKGMDTKQALRALQSMVENDEIDPDLVDCLKSNYDRINGVRAESQLAAVKKYEEFLNPVGAGSV